MDAVAAWPQDIVLSRRGLRMGFEIERKFLLRNDRWRKLAARKLTIRQAYLSSNGRNSIRVRI